MHLATVRAERRKISDRKKKEGKGPQKNEKGRSGPDTGSRGNLKSNREYQKSRQDESGEDPQCSGVLKRVTETLWSGEGVGAI